MGEETKKDLNELVNRVFPGCVVRKDLVKRIKGNAVVPSYVLEYLLGQYCATDDETTIAAGIENVKKILSEHYVNRNEAELVKSRIKERGSLKVIDRIGVDLNDKRGIYEATFSNLGLRGVPVDSDTVKKNPKLLVGGVWCLIDVEYELVEEKGVSPWSVRSLKTIQLANFDRTDFLERRAQIELDDWIDVLIQSIGFNPEMMGRRNKFFQLMRLIPYCERNYNLIELGPKGTGKSHIYCECSPHGMLLSGGEVTLAKLFVNNSSGKIGLVGYWDCVAFDEFAGRQKKPDKVLVDVMKNYMANKTFSRGIETLGAEASIAFVGNTMHTVPQMLRMSNLFEQLPAAYLDSAFIDRIHNYIPGWEVDIIRGELFTNGYGFIVDYLAEAMHDLRDADFSGRFRKYFTLSPTLSTRDRDGVQKTFSGLMKILFPDGGVDPTKAQVEEVLKYAMEGRKRVKDQLMRIDATYDSVDFSFTDNESGDVIRVATLEEVQYPALYRRGKGESASTVNEDAANVSGEKKADVPAQAEQSAAQSAPKEGLLEIIENQRGIDMESLFGEHLQGAKSIKITDPYVRTFGQTLNMMELMEVIARRKLPEEEISVTLETGKDDLPDQQQMFLSLIKEACAGVGIDFSWSFPNGALHDRFIETDTGWRIQMGRGLDIYQYYNAKNLFAFEARVPSRRACKPFTVSYHRG